MFGAYFREKFLQVSRNSSGSRGLKEVGLIAIAGNDKGYPGNIWNCPDWEIRFDDNRAMRNFPREKFLLGSFVLFAFLISARFQSALWKLKYFRAILIILSEKISLAAKYYENSFATFFRKPTLISEYLNVIRSIFY